MLLENNGIRTGLALVVLLGGGIWIANSATGSFDFGDSLAEAAMGHERVVGSGTIIDQHRDIGDVDSIELEGAYDVAISIGSPPSLTITADDNILPVITSDVEDGNLVISTKGSISTEHRIKLAITVPSLHALEVNSGAITIAGLSGGNLKVSVEGSADIKAAGKIQSLDAEIDGSGDLKFADLDTADIELTINGSGKAAVKAANSLKVEINGSGDVVYAGAPKEFSKEINGSGSVIPAA